MTKLESKSPPPPPSAQVPERYIVPKYAKWQHLQKLVWPVAALAVILLYNFFFTPGFFHVEVRDGHLFGNVIDVLRNAVPVTLLGIGMTLVIATGGVDLSVGAIMAIGGTVSAKLLVDHGVSFPVSILAGLAVSLLCGAWNGMLVAYMGIQPIVATLVLMVSGRGIAQLISGGQNIDVNNPSFDFLTKGAVAGIPFPIILAAGCLLAVGLLTRKTALGLFVESVGNNPVASRYAGINARAVKFLCYTLTGLCAGLAGLHAASEIRSAQANTAGLNSELDAILTVMIGGTALTGGRFSLLGTVVGALILQTTQTMILYRGIPVQSTMLVKAVIILVIAIFQAPRTRAVLGRIFARTGGPR